MKTYSTQDGQRFAVRTSRDLIRQMRARSFAKGNNQKEWMHSTKYRVYQTTHYWIDASSERSFVNGLITSGLIKEIVS